MRLLVACKQCNRQYDASKLQPGNKFRCRCGVVLTVAEPQGHDAAVVCCAHCGAPRKEGALACEFCGADFTLHERDLDTVCPHCCARVSHKAKFCQFCGAAIVNPEAVAGDESKLVCPSCGAGHFLRSRPWADVSLMECNCCAGIWLENSTFQHLTDEVASGAINTDTNIFPQHARAPDVEKSKDGPVRYRPCAACGKLMSRQQYGRHSGVIIDICRYHGVWFDADELPRIVLWLRQGGLTKANRFESQWSADENTSIHVTMSGNPEAREALSELLRRHSTDQSVLGDGLSSLSRWLFGQ